MSDYSPLPEEAAKICQAVHAPPRLVAHLTLVHDVAAKLVKQTQESFPELKLDPKSVLFGAATHDIGKAVYGEELVKPGTLHERKGVELLQKQGVPPNLARFAYTHANWEDNLEIQIEDLLVALADNCWKGKRPAGLEKEAVRFISDATQRQPWEVFSTLDSVLEQLASGADRRLQWQAQFSPDTGA
jgi:putative nucleotidyltransferase with HDIG domain